MSNTEILQLILEKVTNIEKGQKEKKKRNCKNLS